MVAIADKIENSEQFEYKRGLEFIHNWRCGDRRFKSYKRDRIFVNFRTLSWAHFRA